jgi:hypothetical protein
MTMFLAVVGIDSIRHSQLTKAKLLPLTQGEDREATIKDLFRRKVEGDCSQ